MSITISAVVGAYNSEDLLGDTLQSIVDQTRRPDEIVVVDDGSTDATAAVAASFGPLVRVVARENGGCPAAFNTAFGEARGDFVAMCGADDVWEPQKLEWQAAALEAHPEVDFAFGGARNFGLVEGDWPSPWAPGVQDGPALLRHLYRDNTICASSIVIRRSLFEELGPFVEVLDDADEAFWTGVLGAGVIGDRNRFSADDFEYWMRLLTAGATGYYEPRRVVNYRRHALNATRDKLWIHRSLCFVHRCYAAALGDPALVRAMAAQDLFAAGRILYDRGDDVAARRAMVAALRRRPAPRTAAWTALLTLPSAPRGGLLTAVRAATQRG